jgi:hypothetical protein
MIPCKPSDLDLLLCARNVVTLNLGQKPKMEHDIAVNKTEIITTTGVCRVLTYCRI